MRTLGCEVSGRTISLTQEIAKSGEGTVWETNYPHLVAKLYHDPTPERIKKLQLMIATPPLDPMRERGHVTFAWPQDVLKEASGRNVGFVMPKVSDSVPLSTIYNPRLRSRKAPRFNWQYLHTTALNFALAVEALHRERYVIGDIKPQNILVNKNALVSIIDTDSFQVRDPYSQNVFRCLVGSEGFTPAELLGKELAEITQTELHDRFRLGVIVYLLLFGDHPFKGKWMARGDSPLPTELIRYGYWPYAQRSLIKPGPSTIPLTITHPRIQARFQECFTAGHAAPNQRPSAAEWVNSLRVAIADITPCQREHNHLYARSYGRCYWCERSKQLGIDIFNPDLKKKIDQAKKAKDEQRRQQQARRKQQQRAALSALTQQAMSPARSGLTQLGQVHPNARSLANSQSVSLGRIRSQISTLPPTLVGSLLCILSLLGLGVLLVPELEFRAIGQLPDQFELNLRRWLGVGSGTGASAQKSAAQLSLDPAKMGLSHSDSITQVSVSPDGRYVASGSRDMNVKVWDLQSGALVRSLSKHFEAINFVRFSQDGKSIVASSKSGNVVFWSFPQGEVLKTLEKASETGGGSLLNATIDENGIFLISNGWSGGILIHNLVSNQLSRIETSTLANEQALLALPNSKDALLSTASSGQINVWDLKTGSPRSSFPSVGEWQPIEPVRVMTASSNGNLLATGNWSGTVNLWDYPQGVIRQSFNGHAPSPVSSIAISSSGKWLATGGSDNLIRLWNLKTGRMAKTLSGHRDDVTTLAFSPNNKLLVSGSKDRTVKVWQVLSAEDPMTLVP
ncbi:MAG: hypothetical protein AAGB01_05685 [Cyanobacteria bacterium P01_F01_bin.42]